MNMKSNIAFAAILSAGLLAMVSGKFGQYLVAPHHLEKDAVTVEATETTGGGAAAVAMPEPILAMIASADIERGKGVAKACAACHHIEKGGANGVGPGLYGVVGNQKQAHPGYAYSGTLNKQGGDVWTYEELNKFLWKPKAYDKETKMTYAGVKKAEDRAALIAYLRSMDDAPQAMPSQGEIDQEAKDLAPPVAEAAGQASAAAPDAAAAPKDATAPAAKDAAPVDAAKGEEKPAQ
ncbi:MAG: cytochrome c family protein [Micavibrio aeruginosavorus]|uniref:Cytochrome c family protein n=1 Tax=Micavibrio aeruginosavorus TaxID=349221 RepID=A0A2W5FR56_9BACT|nr:MAG: cytochrome c family protein [Micavibrio aeruginosavorus]